MCSKEATILAEPSNDNENIVLSMAMPDDVIFGESIDAYWLGLTFDPVTKKILSTQKQTPVQFSVWDVGQPDPSAGSCIVIKRSLNWSTRDCQGQAMVICQEGKIHRHL